MGVRQRRLGTDTVPERLWETGKSQPKTGTGLVEGPGSRQGVCGVWCGKFSGYHGTQLDQERVS